MAVDLDAASANGSAEVYLNADFGFTPVLKIEKRLTSSSPVYEGQELTFDLSVRNMLPATAGGVCNFDTETVRDEFTTIEYSRNDGTVNWADDWQEVGESDGPTVGNVFVHSSTHLVFVERYPPTEPLT